MKKKRINFLGIIFFASIVIYLLLLVFRNFLFKHGIEFREVLNNFMFLIKFLIIFIGNIILIKFICKEKHISSFSKAITMFLSFVVSFALIFAFILIPYFFDSREETLAYREGELLVADARTSLHDSYTEFYYPINKLLMKKSDLKEVYSKSPNNIYEYNSKNFLEKGTLDIREEADFIYLNPFNAREKFGKDNFRYLGDRTYDFGGLVIKFNQDETEVLEATIERDIVSYKDVDIIGQSIESIKDKLNNLLNEENELVLEEFLDKDGGKNVKVAKKYTLPEDESLYELDYYMVILILNEDDIVTKVKYVREL